MVLNKIFISIACVFITTSSILFGMGDEELLFPSQGQKRHFSGNEVKTNSLSRLKNHLRCLINSGDIKGFDDIQNNPNLKKVAINLLTDADYSWSAREFFGNIVKSEESDYNKSIIAYNLLKDVEPCLAPFGFLNSNAEFNNQIAWHLKWKFSRNQPSEHIKTLREILEGNCEKELKTKVVNALSDIMINDRKEGDSDELMESAKTLFYMQDLELKEMGAQVLLGLINYTKYLDERDSEIRMLSAKALFEDSMYKQIGVDSLVYIAKDKDEINTEEVRKKCAEILFTDSEYKNVGADAFYSIAICGSYWNSDENRLSCAKILFDNLEYRKKGVEALENISENELYSEASLSYEAAEILYNSSEDDIRGKGVELLSKFLEYDEDEEFDYQQWVPYELLAAKNICNYPG
ncbi:MAG: hypothetical protein KC505_05060, partial [Myxococcales bacterium]|nr:hypothetical protein [Myxococcales bacterium]